MAERVVLVKLWNIKRLITSILRYRIPFTVDENQFNPPPKVKSAVIRITRNPNKKLNCNEQQFKTIVKTAFNQRRKTLRNSLKTYL